MSVMPKKYEYRFVCPLPNGVHARPANCLGEVTSQFESQVLCFNLRNGKNANAKSVLSLVGADIKSGDQCRIEIAGNDSHDAYKTISNFLEKDFSICDEELPDIPKMPKERSVPPVLLASNTEIIHGDPVVPGFGRGKAVLSRSLALPNKIKFSNSGCPESEHSLVDEAIRDQRSAISVRLLGKLSLLEKNILKTHLSITDDVELVGKIHALITDKCVCAGDAIIQAFEYFSVILNSAKSKLIRERVFDLRDICYQLLKRIYGSEVHGQIVLTEPSILIADELLPSQFISMDKSMLSGLILNNSGNTSHMVILARSFGVPTLAGFKNNNGMFKKGQEIIIDANYGFVIPTINDQVERFYVFEKRKANFYQKNFSVYKTRRAETQDGRILGVMANVSSSEEVSKAIENGAEGIGLFRTEMFFMNRSSPPSEQDQVEEYGKALKNAGGKPVIMRTVDIGGDKNVDYLNLSSEENPFLGYRGVRIYRKHDELILTQIRALLRASVMGNLKIMIPMVSCVEEVIFVREMLERVKSEFDAESVNYDREIQLGIMIEVPSAAFCLSQLSSFVDFVSIGTNDLIQYFLAVDRGNKQVNSLYQSRYPAFIVLIKKIVEDAHSSGMRVGMCGEMAGQTENLPLLLGSGIDDVSVSTPYVLKLKAQCACYDSKQCRELLEKSIACRTIEEVDSVLVNNSDKPGNSLFLDVNLIDMNADCVNKEETIKYISDMMDMQQRTNDSFELEKDIWRRERIYSTGLGYGFAVPHCKTKHVNSDSICILRLKHPVEWGSVDDKPVSLVICMILCNSENSCRTHMSVFSKLARRIVREGFRHKIGLVQSSEEMHLFISKELDVVIR